MPDPSGRAVVAIEPGALVSVVFPSLPPRIVTTVAPADDLVIHGPAVPPVPSAVGALGIVPAMAIAAPGGFDIELGCVTVHEPSLPASPNISGACLGS